MVGGSIVAEAAVDWVNQGNKAIKIEKIFWSLSGAAAATTTPPPTPPSHQHKGKTAAWVPFYFRSPTVQCTDQFLQAAWCALCCCCCCCVVFWATEQPLYNSRSPQTVFTVHTKNGYTSRSRRKYYPFDKLWSDGTEIAIPINFYPQILLLPIWYAHAPQIARLLGITDSLPRHHRLVESEWGRNSINLLQLFTRCIEIRFIMLAVRNGSALIVPVLDCLKNRRYMFIHLIPPSMHI